MMRHSRKGKDNSSSGSSNPLEASLPGRSKKRIRWTREENQLFVESCAKYMANNPQARFLSVLKAGMKEMPPNRRRSVISVGTFERFKKSITDKAAELIERQQVGSADDSSGWEPAPIEAFSLEQEDSSRAQAPQRPRGRGDAVNRFSAALREIAEEVRSEMQEISRRIGEIEKTHAEIKDALQALTRALSSTDKPRLFTEVGKQPSAESQQGPSSAIHKPPLLKLLEEVCAKQGEKAGEFRSGAIVGFKVQQGGEEAHVVLKRMLSAYANFLQGSSLKGIYSVTIGASSDEKEYYMQVQGECAFGLLRREAGTQRVEAVSQFSKKKTTGLISVTVVPENVTATFKLNEKDLRIERTRSGGPGGQHVNTTDSAVRVTHKASGERVVISSERSQSQNLKLALNVLSARLAQKAEEEKRKGEQSTKKTQLGAMHTAEAHRTIDLIYSIVKDKATGMSLATKKFFKRGGLEEIIKKSLNMELSPLT